MLWIIAALLFVGGFGTWLYDLDVPCALLTLAGCAMSYAALIKGLRR